MLRFFTCYLSRIFITSVFTLLIFTAKGQHYDFAPATGTFTTVGGTAVDEIETDQQISENIPIGFTFNYFGTNYTELKASSNGFLTFNLSESSASFNEFNGFQTRLIAPLWDDLDGTGGTATYSTTGAAGSRIFTFEWINWKWSYTAPAAGISFQVKLYETSNAIQFIYRQESGAVTGASASVGLIGVASAERFYSLANLGSSPVFSLAGNNSLDTKPATNQIYWFVPGPGPGAPITPTSSVTAATNTGRQMNLTWSIGGGSYRAVFMKQTSAAEDLTVTDGDFLSSSSVFGNFSSYYTSDWYCVYNGNGTAVTVTGLQSSVPYRIKVVEYNGQAGAQKYLNTTGTNNPVSVTSALITPGNPASTLVINRLSGSDVSLDVTEGDGVKRVVFMKASATTGTAPVVNNTTYTANTAFGSGSQIGTTGWYCVFNGTATSGFNVTGLSGSTDYVIHVVDYNGSSGAELYNIALTNSKTFRTYVKIPVPTYTFAASAGTFSPLAGGTTVVNHLGGSFSTDDALSGSIPLGFTFKLAGVPFTELFASTNGFVTFNSILKNSATGNDLVNSFSRPLIAPFWDDASGVYGTAKYATSGVAPNRVFTIEYLNWASDWQASAAGLSFQIKLYETTNKVELIYRKEAGAITSTDASIGLAFANLGSGNFISLSGAGATPTASTTTETNNIAVAPATGQVYSFTPQKLNQTITFPTIPDRSFGTGTITLAATTTSALPLSYSTSNPSVATIEGNIVTLTGVGSVTITASQTGNDVFNAASDVGRTFIVNKGSQMITSFADASFRTFTTTPYELSGEASSGLPVEYTSSNPAVATISGSTVTLVGVGVTEITASQAGNLNYNPTNKIQTLTVTKASQTVTFSAIPTKRYGDNAFQVTASASSGLPVELTSSNPAVATVSGSTITIVGVGVTEITASQAGNANYDAASNRIQTLTVAKASQTITFTTIPTKTFGDAAFEVIATASSGLPVTFSSSNTSVATISGNTITIIGAGSTTISAAQAGNETNEATSSSQGLTVEKADQTITFATITDKTVGDAPITLTASASSGLPVTFHVNNSVFPDELEISGNIATIKVGGSATVRAIQNGNENYNSADASQTFCVRPAKPVVTILNLDTQTPRLEGPSVSGFYKWFKDGVQFETTSAVNVTQPGIYTLVTHREGCESVPSDAVSIVITGTEEVADAGVKIYPNPVVNELIVDLTSLQEKNPVLVELHDLAGRTIYSEMATKKAIVKMEKQNPGVYMLRVNGSKKMITKQIIKK